MKDKPGKLWNRTFLLCMLISGLNAFPGGMLSPALPIYLEHLGRGTEIAGTIVAIATFLSMFTRMIAGGWADKISRKTILLIAFLFETAAFFLFCVANSFPLLLASRCLFGVGTGIVVTVLCTIAFDTLPPELLGTGVGIFALAASAAYWVAPTIGTALAVQGRFLLLFLISAAVLILSIALLLTIPVELTAKAKLWQQARKNGTAERSRFRLSDYLCREALPSAFLLLMNGIIYAALVNFLSHCGVSRGITQVALFFTIESILLVVLQPVCGRLADRMHLGWIIIPGYLLMGIACVLVAFAQNMVPILIASVFYAAGYSATMATTQLWAIRSVELSQRSLANSTYYVGGDVGLALGAYAAGALAAVSGYTAMYLVIAGVCIFSLIWFAGYILTRGKKSKGLSPRDLTDPE